MSKEGTFGNSNFGAPSTKKPDLDDEEEQIRKAIEMSEKESV